MEDVYGRKFKFQSSKFKYIGKETTLELKNKLNWAIKRATDGMENLKYNTAIAAVMELTNTWRRGSNKQQVTSNKKQETRGTESTEGTEGTESMGGMESTESTESMGGMESMESTESMESIATPRGARPLFFASLKMEGTEGGEKSHGVLSWEDAGTFLKLLAPFAPHMTEELWQRLGKWEVRNGKVESGSEKWEARKSHFTHQYPASHFIRLTSIHVQAWPEFDEAMLESQAVTIVVQVNGRVRATIEVKSEKLSIRQAQDEKVKSGKEEITHMAQENDRVKPWLEGKKIKKTVWVPPRRTGQGLVNFVVG